MAGYVFILCPPYCGSTLLWKLVATSDAVSAMPGEGQFLPETAAVMRADPWNSAAQLPWPEIKTAWDGYFDPARPYWLEKSPPNLMRAAQIEAHFQPARFLIMVRDPYAHCEGLMRRNRLSAEQAARFAVHCLARQMANAKSLNSAIRFPYETLTDDPQTVSARIGEFLPGLGALDHSGVFRVHRADGVLAGQIENLNAEKIARLTPDDFAAIDPVLSDNRHILEYWGYACRGRQARPC